MPRITVLMAVYNEEKRPLKTALNSVLCQTYTDFEFLIIDDHSTDTLCQQILRDYAEKDNRITLIRNEKNLGLTASLNKGIQLAQGEYIARLDSDDLATPERLEKQLVWMEKNLDLALCGSWVYLINEDDEVTGTKTPHTNSNDIRKRILHYNFFTHSTLFARKQALISVGGYTESIKKAQDYDLILKLAAKYPLANLPEYLGYYRISPTSISERSYKAQERFAVTARLRALRLYGYRFSEAYQVILPVLSYIFVPTRLKKQLIGLLSKKA